MKDTDKLLDKIITELKETKSFTIVGDQLMKEILLELKDISRSMKDISLFLGVKNGNISRD